MSTDLEQHRLAAARARMAEAKRRFSAAAVATLRGDSNAAELAEQALHEVSRATAELRRLVAR